MKYTFHNLQHAFDFRPHCPLCHERVLIEGRSKIETVFHDKTYTVGKYVHHHSTRITWRTQDGEEIVFDPNDSAIEMVYHYSNDITVDGSIGYASARFNPSHSHIYDGHLYEKMLFKCEHCGDYEYMIQIIIDVGRKWIDEIVLNHEKLQLKDNNNQIHRVKNIYTFDQTEYTTFYPGDWKFDKVKDYKQTTLPLIPVNFDDPKKTIERIKTLVLFS